METLKEQMNIELKKTIFNMKQRKTSKRKSKIKIGAGLKRS
jgi:hypothetical protein